MKPLKNNGLQKKACYEHRFSNAPYLTYPFLSPPTNSTMMRIPTNLKNTEIQKTARKRGKAEVSRRNGNAV